MKIYKDECIFPEELYPLLGNNIRRLRKQWNMTQEKLAMVIDVDQKYISRIEAGKARPGMPIYLQIANALQVSIDAFLDGAIEEGLEQTVTDMTSVHPSLGQEEQKLLKMLQNAVYQYIKEKG